MVDITTKQVESFAEALLVIICVIFLGYTVQKFGFLLPEWFTHYSHLNRASLKYLHEHQFVAWFKNQYKTLLIFCPIKYIGNFLYYIVLPLEYFRVLSTSFTAYESITDSQKSTDSDNPFLYQNIIICVTAKLFLLLLAALFSTCLYYSRRHKFKQQTGVLTNEAEISAYMAKYRQVEFL